ncbi:hypothetical protein [Engelhardtia mirabilis]|uniref:Uncharacterized protein n=1 Tax=Engelhardtia mirabilis TaxID=2528011 RepID=A0A518BRI5_9BACT|nr:hypothetical protein Pla133_46800 [Planctomycetes bacterium Pla133]QDV03886.1 hypothetical protein Pla86_46780 [Planctomycetes bacterium Pla86]
MSTKLVRGMIVATAALAAISIATLSQSASAAMGVGAGGGPAASGTAGSDPTGAPVPKEASGNHRVSVCNCTSSEITGALKHAKVVHPTFRGGGSPSSNGQATGQSGDVSLGAIPPGKCRTVKYKFWCEPTLLLGWVCELTSFTVIEFAADC